LFPSSTRIEKSLRPQKADLSIEATARGIVNDVTAVYEKMLDVIFCNCESGSKRMDENSPLDEKHLKPMNSTVRGIVIARNADEENA
jgi:hypothetical protein